MYKHKDTDFSDNTEKVINLDTQEEEKKEKTNENKNWIKFVSYWKTSCFKIKGIQPDIQPSKDKPTFHRIKRKYTNEQIVEIIDFFLDSKKSDEHLSITACFSADTTNKWKIANK